MLIKIAIPFCLLIMSVSGYRTVMLIFIWNTSYIPESEKVIRQSSLIDRWSYDRKVWRYKTGNRIRDSKKDKCNDQNKMYKKTNNVLQYITQKAKHRVA